MNLKSVNKLLFKVSSAAFMGGFLLWGGMQITFFSSYPTEPDKNYEMVQPIIVKNRIVYIKPWMHEFYNYLWYFFILSAVFMCLSIVIARGNPLDEK